jgi:hypothetical protein
MEWAPYNYFVKLKFSMFWNTPWGGSSSRGKQHAELWKY